MVKTILVTGSTGWLGGKLCEALVARGVKVVGLARRETKITGVKSLTADLATGAGLAEAKQLMESWKQEVGLDREKFAEIAKRESHCPTAEDGGDLGFMVRSACSQDFNDILFEKEAPGVYGPITTPAGLHLIYLNSCRDPTPNDNHFSGKSTLTENLPKMPWQK